MDLLDNRTNSRVICGGSGEDKGDDENGTSIIVGDVLTDRKKMREALDNDVGEDEYPFRFHLFLGGS